MIDKRTIRERMKALAALRTPETASRDSMLVTGRVLTLPQVAGAKRVFCYVGMPGEVDTRRLIQTLLGRGVTVAVPRVVGPASMEAHVIDSLDDCVPGAYGIPVPRRERLLETTPEVCITPGVAFASNGQRLGHGKGYYDAYLAAHEETCAVGLAFEEQIVEAWPADAWDQAMRWIVTPARVMDCRG